MRTRRSLFGLLAGAFAATAGRGDSLAPESSDPVDPHLAVLLRKLRAARPGEKTAALEDVAEELARRQQLLDLEVRALAARGSRCPCPEEELEDADTQICGDGEHTPSRGER